MYLSPKNPKTSLTWIPPFSMILFFWENWFFQRRRQWILCLTLYPDSLWKELYRLMYEADLIRSSSDSSDCRKEMRIIHKSITTISVAGIPSIAPT